MAWKSATEYAINYLSRYPKTEQEMKIMLYTKGYDTEEITKTMKILKENNFINDEKFAESFFYSEVEKKGKPLFVIKKKLQQRGIPEEILSSYVENNEESLQMGIEKGIEREINAYKKKGVDGFDIIQKILRKGYRLQDIKTVIRKRQEKSDE